MSFQTVGVGRGNGYYGRNFGSARWSPRWPRCPASAAGKAISRGEFFTTLKILRRAIAPEHLNGSWPVPSVMPSSCPRPVRVAVDFDGGDGRRDLVTAYPCARLDRQLPGPRLAQRRAVGLRGEHRRKASTKTSPGAKAPTRWRSGWRWG